MVPVGETKRLILQPLGLADAPQIQELFPHWEIVRYLRNVVPWPYPANGALEFIRDVALPQMTRGESWIWTLRLKSEPELIIGNIHLRKGERDHRGFWLGLKWHGQGLMSEGMCVDQRLLVWDARVSAVAGFKGGGKSASRSGFQRNKGCGSWAWRRRTMYAAGCRRRSGR